MSIKILLTNAIRSRLFEVMTDSKNSGTPEHTDSEECLRMLMVKYYPKLDDILNRSTHNEVILKEIFKALISLESLASDDLRYMDVFNNFYEKISRHSSWKKYPEWLEFLQSYAYVLEKQLQKISNEYSEQFMKNFNINSTTLESIHLSEIKEGIKVLVLADHFITASRIIIEIMQVKNIESHILICKNRFSSFKFILNQILSFSLSSNPRLLIKMILKKRIHIFFKPLHSQAIIDWLKKNVYCIGLHGMGVIYRQEIIDSFTAGILNSHIGILPQFRGRSVLEWSLLMDKPTGVTIFFIDKGIDTGRKIVLRHLFSCTPFSKISQAKDFAFKLNGFLFKEALTILLSKNYKFELNEGGPRYYVMSQLFTNVVSNILKTDRRDHG